MQRLGLIFVVTILLGGGVAMIVSSRCEDPCKTDLIAPANSVMALRTEPIEETFVEPPLVLPARSEADFPDSYGDAKAFLDALHERDETIKSLRNDIARLEQKIAKLEREKTEQLVDEFRLVAAAEGVDPRVTDILAEMVLPQLGEIPDRRELAEIAPVALEFFPKLDELRNCVKEETDEHDPDRQRIALQRQELFAQWNRATERILGFDRAQKIHYGPKGR